jgi:outer membrane protein
MTRVSRRIPGILRWLAVVSFSFASAREASAQTPLTVEGAIEAALTRNASLRAARADADDAAARADEARSGFFPRVSASENWRRGDEPVFVFSSLLSARRFAAANLAIDALNHPDPTGFFRASVGIEQVLFDGGRLRAVATAAAKRRDAAIASADEASSAVALRTTEIFGRAIVAEASRRAADAGLAAARDDLQRARQRREAGVVTDADVLALTVYAADLERRVIDAEGEAAIARAELNRVMGMPVAGDVRVAEPSMAAGDEFGDSPDLQRLFAEAEAGRPALKRALAARDAAAAGRREARSVLIPQIGAQAAFDVSGTTFGDRASSWIVGGELRWTFSTGGAELAHRRAAAAAALRSDADLDDARAAVQVEILAAVRRLQGARAREAAGRAAVDQAHESQRVIRDRFEAGMSSVNDVLRASTAVLDADANRVGALVDALVARAALRRAVGRTP